MAAFNLDSIVDGVLGFGSDDSFKTLERIKITVLVDESASPQLIECAKLSLIPKDDNVSLRVEPFYDSPYEVEDDTDLCIILAGSSYWVGASYLIAVSKDIHAVVLADHLTTVVENSKVTDFPIIYSDIISRETLAIKISSCQVMSDLNLTGVERVKEILKTPIRILGLDDICARFCNSKQKTYEDMIEALGDWVMTNCPELRDTFAEEFSFAMPAKVRSIIRNSAYQNAVTAAIFFMPGSDFPVMTMNQVKMLFQIERAYGYGLDKQTIVEVAAVLIIALTSRTVVRKVCKHIPILGWLVKVLAGYAITLAMGYMFRYYCDCARELPDIPGLDLFRSSSSTIDGDGAEERFVSVKLDG